MHAFYEAPVPADGDARPVPHRMFVALSRFTVKNDMKDAVREAFIKRPHLVDDAPGFLGMQVMNAAENSAEFWLVTRWRDEASYRAWHKSHRYHDSHAAIPKGLKLVPESVELRFFEAFAE